jgi:hypothetical protein
MPTTSTSTTICNEPNCRQQCTCLYPAGIAGYQVLATCEACDACHDVCEAEAPGICQGQGQEQGCSVHFMNCPQHCCRHCMRSNCAELNVCLQQLMDCENDPDCSELLTCLSGC